MIEELSQQIVIAGGKPLGLMMDNCQINQKTFQYFNAKNVPSCFLLNDTVYILKCIQNNWVAEKLQCLNIHCQMMMILCRMEIYNSTSCC